MSLRAKAQEVYASYPAARWPNPTPYNNREKIRRRLQTLNLRRKRLQEKRRDRRDDGALTIVYQRTKLEMVVLLSKQAIAYPTGNDRRIGNRSPVIFALQSTAIRLADGLYMSRGNTKEDRARDKKQQLLDILMLASDQVAPHIPEFGQIMDMPMATRLVDLLVPNEENEEKETR